MERTLVSWNVPNLISVNLMAWFGFLLIVAVIQLFTRGKSRATGANGNGGTTVADTGY